MGCRAQFWISADDFEVYRLTEKPEKWKRVERSETERERERAQRERDQRERVRERERARERERESSNY